MSRDEKKLLPCPFCGSQPQIENSWGETIIWCLCHAHSVVNHKSVAIENEDKKSWHYDYERSEKEAINLWNTRKENP